MSVAWFIVLEREIPGLDHFVSGKALARVGEELRAICEEAGVTSLMQFFSATHDQLAGFAEENEIDHTHRPAEAWFSPEEGLITIRALIQAVSDGKVARADRILDDLRQFRRVLEVAKENGVRWHLAVDF